MSKQFILIQDGFNPRNVVLNVQQIVSMETTEKGNRLICMSDNTEFMVQGNARSVIENYKLLDEVERGKHMFIEAEE